MLVALRLEPMLRAATMLQQPAVWSSVVESQPELALAAMTRATCAGASPLHGLGLFASRDIEREDLVTLYPVHAIGGTDGSATIDEDREHFETVQARAYRIDLPHSGARDTWVDVNPLRERVPGWLGHLANDVATCADPAEAAILGYYDAAATANAVLVPLADAVPLIALTATRKIVQGEEICVTYGHDYWLTTSGGGAVPPYTPAVLRAARDGWKDTQRAHTSLLAKRFAHEAAFLEVVLEQLGGDD
eukprot:4469717-Prymnesium_polylepis.1